MPQQNAAEMRAIVQDRFGSAEVLELAVVRRPGIGSTQCLSKYGPQAPTEAPSMS